MRKFIVLSCVAAGAVTTLLASAGPPPPKASICHVGDEGGFNLITVSQNAVGAHMGHGDVGPGSWWPDADADGFGDPDVEPSACPESGYVANADDCDAADASVHPGADEICGDGVDQDCDGEVDDGCVPPPECPCFTEEFIVQHVQDRLYDQVFEYCWIFSYADDGYDGRQLLSSSSEYSGTNWLYEGDNFLAVNTHQTAYCAGSSQGFLEDEHGVRFDEWNDYASFEYLTDEQYTACEAVLAAATVALEVTCTDPS